MCISSFKNWKINTLSSKIIQTEKAKSSQFDRTRGYKNQKFPTQALSFALRLQSDYNFRDFLKLSPTFLRLVIILTNHSEVLCTVCYTNRQITALTFFAINKKTNKNCQKKQNSLILNAKKWIQRPDSIQIWSMPA